MQEKYYPPPPQTTPTFDMFEIKNQYKGIEDYIGYRFPLSLSTIWRKQEFVVLIIKLKYFV